MKDQFLIKFENYITSSNLFDHNSKLLLAVSGGPDSMVMMHAINLLKYDFAVCHVNFQLRGAESNDDEKLVKEYTDKIHKKLFLKTVDTTQYATEHKLSIEMAAREIRYNEFQRIVDEYNYTHIVIAHHIDDTIETFFLNLLRGAGIKGLTGISTINGKIVRPMMCFSRQEIVNYIKQNSIPYHIDHTNNESEYARNKIRNLVMPILEQINPSAKKSIYESICHLKSAKNIYDNDIKIALKKCVKTVENKIIVDTEEILNYIEPESLLFEAINQYGFNKTACHQIFENFNKSGKQFFAAEYQLITSRNSIIIEPYNPDYEDNYNQQITIENTNTTVETLVHFLTFSIITPEEFSPKRDMSTAYFDYDKIDFPLEITHWQKGDYYTPFGMHGKQKVSDLLTDLHIDIQQKKRIEIIRNNQKIIWIIGLKNTNEYRITNKTTKILKIEAKTKSVFQK